jgi:ABC-2 type transport system permease protein
MLKPILEFIRKDLLIFASDRRAMMISFAVPVVIASFLASITGGGETNASNRALHVPLLVVNEDSAPVTKQIIADLGKDPSVKVIETTATDAKLQIKSGKSAYAITFPKGFGDAASKALMGGSRPELPSLSDPSREMEIGILRGVVIQTTVRNLSRSVFGASPGGGELPFVEAKSSPVSTDSQKWSGKSHAFAGMAVQGVLFLSIEAAMGLMRERKQGIWKRLRSSPVAPGTLLVGRWLSSAIRALAILTVVWGVGMLAFQIRVQGSGLGFALICLSTALMAGGFGLFIAALGKTEQQSRGLATLAVLALSMLGGAWFPSFLMPEWVQKVTLIMPSRWAIDGFDAMTWRANDLVAALPITAVLLGFAVLFTAIAIPRFRLETE